MLSLRNLLYYYILATSNYILANVKILENMNYSCYSSL